MIQLQGAGKRFGHKLLFEDCDWLITPKERTGLVGGNGTGKSTLLKILCGMETLDYGDVTLRQRHQPGLPAAGRPVAHRPHRLRRMHERVRRPARDGAGDWNRCITSWPSWIRPARNTPPRPTACITSIPNFAIATATRSRRRSGTVLNGLGFRKEDWTRRTEEFSGGWQMRIALAKLLLEKPNLLLLDEPTNHLDLEARNWLESYLASYPNACILISHDRYFLDVTVNRTVEIWNKKVNFYSGNYEKYLNQKAERKAQLEAAYRNQRERIEQLEAFINRFRAQATKAKQVQSRIKELDKIERIEIPPDEQTIHFSFPQPKPSGRIVAEFKDVSKSYGAEARLQRRELHHRARRPHRAGGREWRGQIDADQAAAPAPSRSPPAATRWATTRLPTTSRRINTRSSTSTRACWTI